MNRTNSFCDIVIEVPTGLDTSRLKTPVSRSYFSRASMYDNYKTLGPFQLYIYNLKNPIVLAEVLDKWFSERDPFSAKSSKQLGQFAQLACLFGHLHLIKRIFSYLGTGNTTHIASYVLASAAQRNDVSVAQWVQDQGVVITLENSHVREACTFKSFEYIKFVLSIVSDSNFYLITTWILLLIEKGYIDIAEYILEYALKKGNCSFSEEVKKIKRFKFLKYSPVSEVLEYVREEIGDNKYDPSSRNNREIKRIMVPIITTLVLLQDQLKLEALGEAYPWINTDRKCKSLRRKYKVRSCQVFEQINEQTYDEVSTYTGYGMELGLKKVLRYALARGVGVSKEFLYYEVSNMDTEHPDTLFIFMITQKQFEYVLSNVSLSDSQFHAILSRFVSVERYDLMPIAFKHRPELFINNYTMTSNLLLSNYMQTRELVQTYVSIARIVIERTVVNAYCLGFKNTLRTIVENLHGDEFFSPYTQDDVTTCIKKHQQVCRNCKHRERHDAFDE